MLIIGDKIKLVRQIDGFNCMGHEFEVTNISNDNAISFKSDFGIGVMTWKEYNDHFEKVAGYKTQSIQNKWNDWQFVENERYQYKTNNKKVIVKSDGITAESCCCKSDKFDLQKGIELCLARIEIKKIELEAERKQSDLDDMLRNM